MREDNTVFFEIGRRLTSDPVITEVLKGLQRPIPLSKPLIAPSVDRSVAVDVSRPLLGRNEETNLHEVQVYRSQRAFDRRSVTP